MSSIFQLTKSVERKLAPVFKILSNNDKGFLLWQSRVESNFNPNRTGLFGIFRFGDAALLLSSLFVDLSQQNFVQRLTIKALAQIWEKICIKLMTP